MCARCTETLKSILGDSPEVQLVDLSTLAMMASMKSAIEALDLMSEEIGKLRVRVAKLERGARKG